MKEIWLPVVGYEGTYEVSNSGRIKSLDRFCNTRFGTLKKVKGLELRLSQSQNGYICVPLCRDGVETRTLFHRVVAKAFIPNPFDFPQVNHIDGNKSNNTPANLEWVTAQQNCNHAITQHLYVMQKGERNGNAKVTQDIVRDIRRQAAEGVFHRTIAAQYRIGRKAVTKIVNRQRWAHII